LKKLRDYANKINDENKVLLKICETNVDQDSFSNAFETGFYEEIDYDIKVESTDINIFEIS
jgi:hypothetical protein